jgi:hypothetical protein
MTEGSHKSPMRATECLPRRHICGSSFSFLIIPQVVTALSFSNAFFPGRHLEKQSPGPAKAARDIQDSKNFHALGWRPGRRCGEARRFRDLVNGLLEKCSLNRELSGNSLRNHKTLPSPKLNQVCIDREPDNSSGPPFARGLVSGQYQLAKRQQFLFVIGFHDVSLGLFIREALWGVHPMRGQSSPGILRRRRAMIQFQPKQFDARGKFTQFRRGGRLDQIRIGPQPISPLDVRRKLR